MKAGLETWFDEAMARAERAYSALGDRDPVPGRFGIAIVRNISTIETANNLYVNQAAREQIADAAAEIAANDGGTPTKVEADLDALSDASKQLNEIGFQSFSDADSK